MTRFEALRATIPEILLFPLELVVVVACVPLVILAIGAPIALAIKLLLSVAGMR